MKYAIQINSSPFASSVSETAYQFIKAVLQMEHEVVRVFFYQEGVYHAFRYATPPDDEVSMGMRWSTLAHDYGVDLVVCVSAAQRRGLLDSGEAQRQGKQDNDLAVGFRLAGLGQWVDAILQSDRYLEFG